MRRPVRRARAVQARFRHARGRRPRDHLGAADLHTRERGLPAGEICDLSLPRSTFHLALPTETTPPCVRRARRQARQPSDAFARIRPLVGVPRMGLPRMGYPLAELPFLGARLAHHRDRLPGAAPDTPLLAVSRTGCAIAGLPTLTPTELITAWPV